MKNGLIGHTGFVGSNLLRQCSFQKTYNSENISQIKGEHFSELYCAGVSAEKWWANKYPENDWQNIEKLLEHLKHVSTDRFVLISTIDVYSKIESVDEDSPIDTKKLNSYGVNRRKVEQFVQTIFPTHHIIRLPGLFGIGLKKNAIFDFLHDNEIDKIHSEAQYQFYSLENVYRDIVKAVTNNISLINFATEPVTISEIVARAFKRNFSNRPFSNAPKYNVKTKYAKLYGSPIPYMGWKEQVLEQLSQFVKVEKVNIK